MLENEKQQNIDALYDCIQTRPRPEDVAEVILEILRAELTKSQIRTLEKAAKHSLKRRIFQYSSMATDFARVIGAERQVRKAEELFIVEKPLSATDCVQPKKVEDFLNIISEQIGYKIGQTSFLRDRYNRSTRKLQGIDISKRQYNKRWRFLKRLDQKIRKMIADGKIYDFTRISKSALAVQLTKEQLAQDIPTACFIAYYSARMSMRSVFTNTSQVRAFDQVAKMLYDNAIKSPSLNWLAIAYVHAEEEVLENLTVSEKGELLGKWSALLKELADTLEDLWRKQDIDLDTMIVRRGNDSSTWNIVAEAWNKVRTHWINLLYVMGLERTLDDICPGKVLRLMAADVAAWHGKLHPDTRVWRKLPKPWEVLKGKVQCTRDLIGQTCATEGVSNVGWIVPMLAKTPAEFTPTPELVHGVSISSPEMATILKKAKYFSGKPATKQVAVEVVRDKKGFALFAGKKIFWS